MGDNGVYYIFIALLAVLLVIALLVIFWLYSRQKKLLLNLNNMLDRAIAGDYKEDDFNETLLSATENKCADFLSASLLKSQNLAEEKDKIKSLIADISHQTKTPIANILLYAQLLAENNLPKSAQESLQELEKQTQKLNFLISSLVKISRLETGILVLEPQNTGILPMIENVVGEIKEKAAAKQITLTVNAENFTACFDPKWTAEAVFNIVDNAVKYTPKGGNIKISAEQYEMFCRIDIKDDGIGIEESEYAKVFSRFYRSPRVSQSDGVGIGLYLARVIVFQQGGYIKLTSEMNKGSIFSVFLPI
jgi:signal transduction histidine kinase